MGGLIVTEYYVGIYKHLNISWDAISFPKLTNFDVDDEFWYEDRWNIEDANESGVRQLFAIIKLERLVLNFKH
jgi:hypothetical protein